MLTDVFYPYATAPEGVKIVFGLDDNSSQPVDGDVLEVFDTDVTEVRLRISASIPPAVIRKVLHSSEQVHAPTRLYLVCRSDDSRRREAYAFPDDGGTPLRVSLDRSKWKGTVECQVILVRTDTNRSLPAKYGSDRGTALAWSVMKRVLLDPPRTPPGNEMVIRWEDFSTTGRTDADHMFSIDAAGEFPEVVLNSGIPNLYHVLTNRGTRGREARIRDAVSVAIVHQVWSSVLGSALLAMLGKPDSVEPEGEDITETLLDSLDHWEVQLLRDWSPYIYPYLDKASAFEQLVHDARTPRGSRDLLVRLIPEAIQRRFETRKGFDGLIKDHMSL